MSWHLYFTVSAGNIMTSSRITSLLNSSTDHGVDLDMSKRRMKRSYWDLCRGSQARWGNRLASLGKACSIYPISVQCDNPGIGCMEFSINFPHKRPLLRCAASESGNFHLKTAQEPRSMARLPTGKWDGSAERTFRVACTADLNAPRTPSWTHVPLPMPRGFQIPGQTHT